MPGWGYSLGSTRIHGTWGKALDRKPIIAKSGDEISRILAFACSQREMMILATPYLSFESNFLQVEDKALHARITMSVEDATYGLRSEALSFRFPHATRFLEGRTRLLGFGMLEGRRTLRLAIPAALLDDDHRSAYRAERVGRVEVSFSTPRFDLCSGILVNLSTTGARIQSPQNRLEDALKPGDALQIAIPLNEEVRINGRALVVWANGYAMGVRFDPVLPDPVLAPLSRWVLQRWEEDRERSERVAAPPVAVQARERHLVLVSASEELEAALREYLTELPALVRIAPTMAALKAAALEHPPLILFHVPGLGLDERKRLKALAETLGPRQPFLLLGGLGVDGSVLMDLGTELKATASFVLGPKPSPFFNRLLQGILRRHGGETA